MSEIWLYSEHLGQPGDRVELDAEESHHAASSRRLAAGDDVTLFDGMGGTALGVLHAGARKKDPLQVAIGRVEHTPRPTPLIHLACAVPRGDRLSTLLDMCTQAGLDRVTPVDFERSVVRAADLASKQSRWRRILIEACKQSRRSWLPELRPTEPPRHTIAATLAARGLALLADPGGDNLLQTLSRSGFAGPDRPPEILIIIGPEGGVSARERGELIAAGAALVSLGASIQRIETAAVTCCASLNLARS